MTGAALPTVEVPAELRYPISVALYHRMIEQDLLGEDDRVELLEGVIVAMPPQRADHSALIARLTRWLVRSLGDEYSVRPQLPLTLGSQSEPEPEVAVIRSGDENLKAQPSSALLVVEVSRGSLAKDRDIKGKLYARAGIPEYWIVDVAAEAVEVYRDPDAAAGRYGTLLTVRGVQLVEARSLPGVSIPLASLFG